MQDEKRRFIEGFIQTQIGYNAGKVFEGFEKHMQLAIHTGAHFTEEERLMKCLLRNKDAFSKQGIAVPGPGKYRRLLKQTLDALKTAPAAEGARDVLLDAIMDDENADRLILSNAHFFGAPRAAVRAGVLYPSASERMLQIRKLFPHDEIEMFMAMRNPATLLPAMFEQSPKPTMESYLGAADPCEIRWSNTLYAIRNAVPDVSITVWCREDTPLIWAQIVREIAGLDLGGDVAGEFDLVREIMSDEGMRRFEAYLKSHPDMTEMQKRRVISAFLDKFALDDEIEEELNLAGWTEDLMDDMTDFYDEDMLEVQRIPGVTLIAP